MDGRLDGSLPTLSPKSPAKSSWHWIEIFTTFENIHMQVHINYIMEYGHWTSSGWQQPSQLQDQRQYCLGVDSAYVD